MPGAPVVSVVLPVWNGERFLADAIDSITAQTVRALELLVVDDGSTDGSAAIADGRAAADTRITVLRRAHGGITTALNAGLEAARAPYVARMDADDWARPMRLERQLAFLDAHPDCVALGSDVDVVDASDDRLGVLSFPRGHADIVAALARGHDGFAHPSVVMRRALVLAAGGYRAEYFPSEDMDLWVRLSRLGTLANLDEPLLRYRRHLDATGLRERERQIIMTARVADAARGEQGLAAPPRRALLASADPRAAYHFECARIALRSGCRGAAFRHSAAIAAAAPWSPVPYAMLAACLLPASAVPTLARVYNRITAT